MGATEALIREEKIILPQDDPVECNSNLRYEGKTWISPLRNCKLGLEGSIPISTSRTLDYQRVWRNLK